MPARCAGFFFSQCPRCPPRLDLDHLWLGLERYVRLFVSTFVTMDTVMDLHVELYEACAGGDVLTSEKALTRHYVEAEQTVREGFEACQADQAEALRRAVGLPFKHTTPRDRLISSFKSKLRQLNA